MNRTPGRIVVALGGNAVSPPGAPDDIPNQFRQVRASIAPLVDLIAGGWRMIVTHGNGPQVGNVLRRVELAEHEVYPLPLDICVADTQGGMGYMIAQCLNNALRGRGCAARAVAVVTSVEVDPDDPEFDAPSKPIGRVYDAAGAAELGDRYGLQMRPEPGGSGFRRVVPSPRPRAIVEMAAIQRMLDITPVVVAGGGGGVPVVRGADGDLSGVEAVIDKDRVSALLACGVEAELLVLATCVEGVALDFGRPTQRFVSRMSVAEARRGLAAGQFPPGSMGPKIEAAIEFVTQPGGAGEALVCALERVGEALAGRSGTRIVGA